MCPIPLFIDTNMFIMAFRVHLRPCKFIKIKPTLDIKPPDKNIVSLEITVDYVVLM